MKKFEDVGSLSRDIALRKKRAGETRFGRSASDAEKPKDVFRAVCGEIANQFTPEGFAFSKSNQTMKRKRGDLTDEIWFQSSHNNVAGEYVALWIHAAAKRMKEWRAENPYPGSIVHDRIAGDQIGNLRPKQAWLEWNLAHDRDAQVASAADTIRQVALPTRSRPGLPRHQANV